MRVALVHDFLIECGGAERVLEALHEIWPKAPLFTAFYDPKSLGGQAKRFKNWKIITSWGTRLPFWKQLVSPYRIFAKSFFESFDLSKFDLVISSSSMYMAKAVKVPNGVHICYCHTPPRFLYGYPTAYQWRRNPVIRVIGEIINHFMRVWDFEVSQPPSRKATDGQEEPARRSLGEGRVDYFIANSREVQRRIKKFYRRESKVIYPPVDVSRFARMTTKARRLTQKAALSVKHSALSNYFLVVSRLVAAKKVDIAVEVYAKLGLPLKVVGTGRELQALQKLADESRIKNQESGIEFLGDVEDRELVELYQNCRAVIFPAAQEDFGLVPVEAMAAGRPVIACAQGGVLESVIDWSVGGKGKCTGVYFDPPTGGSLTLAINNFFDLEKRGFFDPKFIRHHAQKFSKERFKREILKFVEEKLK